MHPEDACGLKMIELGYAVNDATDTERNLYFRVVFQTREGVDAALRAIDSYNEFEAERVIRALDDAGLAERTRIEVGREASPALYVDLFGNNEAAVTAALLRAGADEVDTERRAVRAWWD